MEYLDQTAHLRSLIIVFDGCFMGSQVPNFSEGNGGYLFKNQVKVEICSALCHVLHCLLVKSEWVGEADCARFPLLSGLWDICGQDGRYDALHYVFDNMFIGFDSKLFAQIVGVPVVAGCDPLGADVFLFCYGRDLILMRET